jgi:hypothetical protein
MRDETHSSRKIEKKNKGEKPNRKRGKTIKNLKHNKDDKG